MKKLILIAVILCMFCSYPFRTHADFSFGWANDFGEAGNDESGRAIAMDGSDNIYVVGYFANTVDFDPGAGTADLTSNGSKDIFIAKYDSSGNYVWAKQIGGTSFDQGIAIAIDGSGNVYTTGSFAGTADFDPGVGTANLTSASGSGIFISKLDTDGNYIWADQMSTIFSPALGAGIKVDSSGNVYTSGYFNNTIDFDPGAGTANLTSAGDADIFISKLDSSGNYVWAKQLGGTGGDSLNAVALDSAGSSVYLTGSFTGTADFDPSAGTANLTSAGSSDIFVAKLDSAGNYVWAKRIGNTAADLGYGIDLDSNDNVYTTGEFALTVDFDPGAGTANLTTVGQQDIFILKLDSSGNYVWAKNMDSTGYSFGTALTVDSSDNIYTTGEFQNTVDLDPGVGTVGFTSFGNADVFVSELDSSGNYVSAVQMGGTNDEFGYGVVIDSNGSVDTAGSIYSAPADFDPGTGVANISSTGGEDIFMSKLIVPIVTHTLTYTAGVHGSITGTSSQTVNDGDDGTAVTAVADTGYHFLSWSDASTTNPRTDTNVTGDVTVTANFEIDPTPPAQTPSGGGGSSGGHIGPISPPFTPLGNDCKAGDKFSVISGLPCFASPTPPTPKTPGPTTPLTCLITLTLRQGNTGEQVKCLQTILNINSDGIFGPKTKAAVVEFQKNNGLVADGIVGPRTRAKIQLLNS